MRTSTVLNIMLVASGLALAGCDDKKSGGSSGNPVMAPVDYLDAAAKAKLSSEQKVDTIAINQAIQMYSSQEGHYPADLQELVTKGYMRALPKPPFGMKFEYDATKGEVTVVKQ